MAIAPMFASSCDLAERLPAMIAELLDIERKLKRRFREDSVTDILVGSLLPLPGNGVVVLTPPELKTGGDFDLLVVDPQSGDAIQFRIQAKRLTPHKHYWEIGSYAELSHPHNSGSQSQTLLRGLGREAISTIPLYAFYNPAHVCTASGDTVSGIELASGWEIRERINAIVKVKPKRLPYKRIGSLQPLFFPLSSILCTPAATPACLRYSDPGGCPPGGGGSDPIATGPGRLGPDAGACRSDGESAPARGSYRRRRRGAKTAASGKERGPTRRTSSHYPQRRRTARRTHHHRSGETAENGDDCGLIAQLIRCRVATYAGARTVGHPFTPS